LKIYRVGGSVRDQLLGLKIKDRDFTVIGSSEEEMLSLGFRKVGADFPVFIHPQTGEEYALARRESRTGEGYLAFNTVTDGVTLEEDLQRRDLTINSIAVSESGELFDPFGGLSDIRGRVFRHTSSAFSEDAVRVLRLARFQSRFPDFKIAIETIDLVYQMVADGLLRELKGERVLIELQKTASQGSLKLFFETLQRLNSFDEVFPYLEFNPDFFRAVDCEVDSSYRLAMLFMKTPDIEKRLPLKREIVVSSKFLREHLETLQNLSTSSAEKRVSMLNSIRNSETLLNLALDKSENRTLFLEMRRLYSEASSGIESIEPQKRRVWLQGERLKALSQSSL
jgi:tRNA nucleotidyltransferase/poly(A) polymerase